MVHAQIDNRLLARTIFQKMDTGGDYFLAYCLSNEDEAALGFKQLDVTK